MVQHQGSILPTKILSSENFSEKYRKFGIHHFFHESRKNYLIYFLVHLANQKFKNVLQNCFICTQLEISEHIFRNLKICTEIREFFCIFWLVGLSPGLNLTISKNREKFCFLCMQKISYRQIFPVKQKNFLHRFFGAASWQDFCNFFL